MRTLLAALAVVACVPAAAATTVPATSLRVTVWLDGRSAGAGRTWTLRCGPAGGTHPRAARACAALAGTHEPFRPVPRDAICTEIYGGPSEALVVGVHAGRRVWARFHRRNGCHISRWQRHAFLFPVRAAPS